MLHSCTPSANKENILKSFSEEWGVIRVLVATIAFGMGVNCKSVHRIIHFGPAKNIESYTQETGRAGRDGAQAIAFLLYNGVLLNHVEMDMKAYVKNDHCRRKTILMHFGEDAAPHGKLHLCCDHCASKCKCGLSDCGKLTVYPANAMKEEETCGKLRSRDITGQKKEIVNKNLIAYHKMLVKKLASTTAKTDLKSLTGIPLLIGFSEIQIQQVLENLENIFSLADICKFVEIWDMVHAHKILYIISDVFQDIQDVPNKDGDEFQMDDEWLIEDWDSILNDDELFHMAVENTSMSEMEDSMSKPDGNISNASMATEVPVSVLETLERMDLQ